MEYKSYIFDVILLNPGRSPLINSYKFGCSILNIYSVPILITGILCALLSVITWLFGRRENINRVFAFFTLTLALDSFSNFAWFQFGTIEHINTWVRFNLTAGFLVPIALILFFFAFTGYDKRMDARVLGIKVRHFQIFILVLIFIFMLLSMFTNLIIQIAENPEHIWDTEFGPVGNILFPLFAGIFFYLYFMVFKGYKISDKKPQKRFILLLAVGTIVWVLSGFGGAILFSPSSEVYTFINYLGTALMAIFYFVAIVNYQSDKVHELNLNLEGKVQDRTRELKQKNSELEDTLNTLKQMQKQVIVREKMATLGQLVAGLTHEINTPISAIRSMNDTRSNAVKKLQKVIKDIAPDSAGKEKEIKNVTEVILKKDQSSL